jgi:hypothetical protein
MACLVQIRPSAVADAAIAALVRQPSRRDALKAREAPLKSVG